MSRRVLLPATAAAWLLFSMLLGDALRVWESPSPVRWHALVPWLGLAVVVAVSWRAER